MLSSFISSSDGARTSSHHVWLSGLLSSPGLLSPGGPFGRPFDKPFVIIGGIGDIAPDFGSDPATLAPCRWKKDGRVLFVFDELFEWPPWKRSWNDCPSAGSSERLRAWIVAESAFE